MKKREKKKLLKQKRAKQQREIKQQNNHKEATKGSKAKSRSSTGASSCSTSLKKTLASLLFHIATLPLAAADWIGVPYVQIVNETIQFRGFFDSDIFNVTDLREKILKSCSGMLLETTDGYLNEADRGCSSFANFPGFPYKVQAKLCMNELMEALDIIFDGSIAQPVLDCMQKAINPECQESFFNDWAGGWQFLSILALIIAGCGATAGLYVGTKKLSTLWAPSDSNKIKDPEKEVGVEPNPKTALLTQ